MSLPRFLADDLVGSAHTAYSVRAFAAEGGDIVVPARRDSTQQGYADCIAECDPLTAACVTSCKRQWYPTSSGPPGTPPALVECCVQTFFTCIATKLDDPAGLIGCAYDSFSCTTSASSPCSRYFP